MREMSLRGSSASAEGGYAAREPEGEAASTPGSEQASLGGLSFATRGPATGRRLAHPRPGESSEKPLDPVTPSASPTTPRPAGPSHWNSPSPHLDARPDQEQNQVLFICCFLCLSVRWHIQRSGQAV